MNFGVIFNEPSDVYHATDCVGSHKLADFVKSPLLYLRKHILRVTEPEEQSQNFLFGEYFHALALEGEQVALSRYITEPVVDRRTKDGKAAWAEFLASAGGRTPISPEDMALAETMVAAIRAKKTAVELLSEGHPEVVFRKQMHAFPIQCRADWWREKHGDRPLFLDVKTIDDIDNFERHFEKYGYYKQGAFYQMVINATLGLGDVYPRVLFLVCEKNEPFRVALREPGEISLDIGRRRVFAELQALKKCYETNNWPGEPDEIRPVELPHWVIAKET